MRVHRSGTTLAGAALAALALLVPLAASAGAAQDPAAAGVPP
ncbi:lysozyme, partial [Streptomyces sp. SID6041]|nr:lysozyme [Streptomyces sp. SID6041]